MQSETFLLFRAEKPTFCANISAYVTNKSIIRKGIFKVIHRRVLLL